MFDFCEYLGDGIVSMELIVLVSISLRGSVLIFLSHLMNSSCLIFVSTWAMGVLKGGNVNFGQRGGV